jgi:MFS family permease
VASPSVAQAGTAQPKEQPRERPARPRRAAAIARAPAWALTAAVAALYLLLAPASSDLAAAGYRSDLFARAGFTLWDNGWYGGHHLPAYSLLAPPLGALLGPQLLGALAMTVAAALFAALVRGAFNPRAERAAALWFALGAGVELFTNRIPFELGLALAIAALLAARWTRGGRRRKRVAAAGLAVTLALLAALASPVAGAFLALAAVAWALGGERGPKRFAGERDALGEEGAQQQDRPARRLLPWAIAAAALAPVAVLAAAFPEGGTEPFVAAAFFPALAATLALALAIPRRRGALRAGAVLYALVLLACYLVPSPVGGNADRLGALLAGPLLACALIAQPAGTYVEWRHRTAGPRSWLPRGWRAAALLGLAPLLLYWQLRAPVADYVSSVGEPASSASYYRPLLAELQRLGTGYGATPARVEIVPTREHGEARWAAAHVPLARGFERQLDVRDDGLFYAGGGASGKGARSLAPGRYRSWLARNAVAYVALPGAPLDYSASAEARLLRSGASGLREVWRAPHWRLFAVPSPAPPAQPPSVLTQLGPESFALRVPRAGSYLVRVRYTPYWALGAGRGCVRRGAEGWTEVQARAGGELRVGIDFSPLRVFERGPRCRS